MVELIDKLLPHRIWSLLWAWLGAALAFVIYFGAIYPGLDTWFEDQYRAGCVQKYVTCPARNQSPDSPFAVSIRAVGHVADFTESEIRVTVTNITDTVQTAVVGLSLTNPNLDRTRVYIRLRGEDQYQDTATLKDMAPYASVTLVFLVRVSGGRADQDFPLEFRLNGRAFAPFSSISMKWDQWNVLRMWFAQNFLQPPGTNVVVPIVGILLFRLLEEIPHGIKQLLRWRKKLIDLKERTARRGRALVRKWRRRRVGIRSGL